MGENSLDFFPCENNQSGCRVTATLVNYPQEFSVREREPANYGTGMTHVKGKQGFLIPITSLILEGKGGVGREVILVIFLGGVVKLGVYSTMPIL